MGRDLRPFPLVSESTQPVTGQVRDSIDGMAGDSPTIVSISDVHGFLAEARSALLTLADHPDYDPVVIQDANDRLHWADNDYTLVFNGDLIDRGPANLDTLRLVARLRDEAPPGRVRVTLGNHEMAVLLPDIFDWDGWFCNDVSPAGRESLLAAIGDGHVVAAYDGYHATYAHAGYGDTYGPERVNTRLRNAAKELQDAHMTQTDHSVQQAVVETYPVVFGMGEGHLKRPPAGLVWLDFQYLPADAPLQIVGHTRHDSVTQKGTVLCQNVIRNTRDSPGGEAVVVETPDSIVSLQRTADGGVETQSYTL